MVGVGGLAGRQLPQAHADALGGELVAEARAPAGEPGVGARLVELRLAKVGHAAFLPPRGDDGERGARGRTGARLRCRGVELTSDGLACHCHARGRAAGAAGPDRRLRGARPAAGPPADDRFAIEAAMRPADLGCSCGSRRAAARSSSSARPAARALLTLGCAGHGVSTTARTSSPPRGRLERQQRVVDRPQAGPRGDDDRQAEVDGEVADRVAERERHEQPADALGDHDVGAQAARARRPAPPARAPCRPARPRGAARPPGRSAAARPRPRVARRRRRAARGRAGRPALGLVEAGDDRLERGDVDAVARAARRASAAASDGLADARVGAGDEDAAHARARLRGAGARCRAARRRTAPRPASRAAATGTPSPGRKPACSAARPSTCAASRSSALRVRGHHRQAQARGALGHGRRADRLGEDAALDRQLADPHRQRGVADDERHDLRRRARDVEALARELVAQRVGVGLQLARRARGCSASSSSAASAPATAGGGGAVEKMSGRARVDQQLAPSSASQAANAP